MTQSLATHRLIGRTSEKPYMRPWPTAVALALREHDRQARPPADAECRDLREGRQLGQTGKLDECVEADGPRLSRVGRTPSHGGRRPGLLAPGIDHPAEQLIPQ